MGLILVGFLGGLLTGISPCILPVLPVLFFAGGTQAARDDLHNGNVFGGRRPYLVILGLVLSFSFFTLAGTFLLTLLHLPETTIIWIGIVALVLVGVGMIVPRFERILEKPFAWIPQREANPDHGGFLLGIALGAVFIPCAGPVLAVVAIAGAKSEISWNILIETAAFAVGVAIPLLVFALAGRGLAERIKGFRRHQRGIRITAGVTMLVLAVAVIPVFNLPQYLLTLVPDYTNGLQSQAAALNKTATTSANCTLDASHVENCGTAPNFVGITQWFNTKNDKPLTLKSLRGKVVLVDFWAYSCINCQRSTPHLNAWYKSYEKDGFVVVGVHAPEYAFEHVPSNVLASAKQQGIKYPIALDNNFDTWDAYQNQYWPAEYLLDGTGKIRHVSFGEGSYGATEAVIRSLLTEEHPGIKLPKPTDVPDKTPTNQLTSETYLGSDRAPAENFVSPSGYQAGTGTYTFPKGAIGLDDYAFSGTFAVAGQSITAKDGPASIRLHYQASHVYLNVGGTGTLTVKDSQGTRVIPISGVPNIRDVLAPGGYRDSTVTITMSKGLTAYSFTFG